MNFTFFYYTSNFGYLSDCFFLFNYPNVLEVSMFLNLKNLSLRLHLTSRSYIKIFQQIMSWFLIHKIQSPYCLVFLSPVPSTTLSTQQLLVNVKWMTEWRDPVSLCNVISFLWQNVYISLQRLNRLIYVIGIWTGHVPTCDKCWIPGC